MRRGAATLLAIALLGAAAAGCGDDDGADTGAAAGLPAAGGGGGLAYALPSLPSTLDPLAASDRAAATVTRQIHEPLVGG